MAGSLAREVFTRGRGLGPGGTFTDPATEAIAASGAGISSEMLAALRRFLERANMPMPPREPPEFYRNNPNYPYPRETFPPPPAWWRERPRFHRWTGLPLYPIPEGTPGIHGADVYGFYRSQPGYIPPGGGYAPQDLLMPDLEAWRSLGEEGDVEEGEDEQADEPDPEWAQPIREGLRGNLDEIFRRHLEGAP